MYTWGGIKYCMNVQMQNSVVNGSWHKATFSQLCRLCNTKDELTVLVLNKMTKMAFGTGAGSSYGLFQGLSQNSCRGCTKPQKAKQGSWCPGRDLSQVCQKCKSKALLLSQLTELYHVVG